MSAIGPGDWVECVKPDDLFALALGSVWYVEEIVPTARIGCTDDASCKAPILHLAGVPRHPTQGLCACGFRPIDRRTTALFQSLLTPAPEVALEDA